MSDENLRWLKWSIVLDFPAPLAAQKNLAINRFREAIAQLEEIPDEIFQKLFADMPTGGMCGRSFFANDPERKLDLARFSFEEGWKAIWSVEERKDQ